MRPSPIQLKHVIYSKVFVEPLAIENQEPTPAPEFDFKGVNVRAKISFGQKAGEEADPREFFVSLEIEIDNKIGKQTPYSVSMSVLGLFNVLPGLAVEKREDLIVVNGASILYGVIREMTLSLTSRFAAGPLTLPGMNFEDDAPSRVRERAAKKVPESISVEPAKLN